MTTPLDWSALEPALSDLFCDLLGLPRAENGDAPVIWEGAAEPFGLAANARLSIVANGSIGTGESTWQPATSTEAPFGSEYGGAAPLYLERLEVHEQVSVRVQVRCYAHTPGANARHYLDRMRPRLEWQSTTEALDALGLGFLSVGATAEPSQTYDDRIRAIAQCDVRLNVINRADDTTQTPTIARVSMRFRSV